MSYRKPHEIPELPWHRRALLWLGRVRWRIPLGVASLGSMSAVTLLLIVWGSVALVRACPGQNHIPTAGRVVGMHYSPPSQQTTTTCAGRPVVCTPTTTYTPAWWSLRVRCGEIVVEEVVTENVYESVRIGSPVCVTYATRTNSYDVTGAGCEWEAR